MELSVAVEDEKRNTLRKWDSTLGQKLAHQAKHKLRGRDGDPTLDARQLDEVVTHLAESDGPAALAQLKAREAECEGRAKAAAARYADPAQQGSWHFLISLPVVRDQVQQARKYRERIAALSAKLPDSPTPPGNAASEVQEVHELLLNASGRRYLADLATHLAAARAEVKARLATVRTSLEETLGLHSDGRRFGGPLTDDSDALWDKCAWLVWRRDELLDIAASLEADESRAAAVQGAAVAKVIASAGGPEVVASAVRDARIITRTWWEGRHPDQAAISAQNITLKGIDDQLAALGPKPSGQLADALRAERAQASKAIATQSGDVDAALKADVAALVASALAGDEPARASIESTARSCPKAFLARFSDDLAGAMFPRSTEGSSPLLMFLSAAIANAG